MHAILQATNGPAAGLRIVVRQGQVVQVGRTAWADYSLPGDAALADRHFALEFDWQGCRIRDLSSTAGVTVNGAKVTLEQLHTGDRVTAGQTVFSVFVEGEAAPERGLAEPADADGGASSQPTAADYCRELELSEPAVALLRPRLLPAPFLDLLIAHELFPDAIRFLAFWLPKPVAVHWGCHCVREASGGQLAAADLRALEAAELWTQDPSEEHRRAVGVIAEANRYTGPATWVALGAFWSSGSLAPPDLEPVPPGPTLTAQALTGGLMMAAALGDSRQAGARYRSFLAQGQALAAAVAERPA